MGGLSTVMLSPRRLQSTLLGLFVSSLLGCDGGKADLPPPPSGERAAIVTAKATPSQAPAPASTNKPAPSAPRKLCEGQKDRAGPKGTIKTAAASGEDKPASSLPLGVGKWVWVNLWAAWCGPCKEEMPRLIAWQKKLSQAGVLVELSFVSIDDDERQLQRFLDAQPKGGVRASYWLPEGEGRNDWLGSIGLKSSVELPVQALVAPSGQLACVIQGAVEDSDYPAVQALLTQKR